MEQNNKPVIDSERVTVEPCNRSNAHEPDWEIRCDGILLETISYLDGKAVADGYALRVKQELAQHKAAKEGQ